MQYIIGSIGLSLIVLAGTLSGEVSPYWLTLIGPGMGMLVYATKDFGR